MNLYTNIQKYPENKHTSANICPGCTQIPCSILMTLLVKHSLSFIEYSFRQNMQWWGIEEPWWWSICFMFLLVLSCWSCMIRPWQGSLIWDIIMLNIIIVSNQIFILSKFTKSRLTSIRAPPRLNQRCNCKQWSTPK